MIHAARVWGIKNLDLLRAGIRSNNDRKVALRNPHASCAITVNAHRAQVDDMGVMTSSINNGAQ